MSESSSFLKRTALFRTLGFMALFLVITSMAVIAAKSCTQATVSEMEARQLNSVNDQTQIQRYVHGHFRQLHALHLLALTISFLIALFAFVDLVPKQSDDMIFGFHFISVFTIFVVGLTTLYASFVAFERPCLAPANVACCQVIGSPGLLSESSKQPLTAVSTQDVPMIAVMVLDLLAGLLLITTALIYFRDVRNEAAECGYLHRVHNEGYIIR